MCGLLGNWSPEGLGLPEEDRGVPGDLAEGEGRQGAPEVLRGAPRADTGRQGDPEAQGGEGGGCQGATGDQREPRVPQPGRLRSGRPYTTEKYFEPG